MMINPEGGHAVVKYSAFAILELSLIKRGKEM